MQWQTSQTTVLAEHELVIFFFSYALMDDSLKQLHERW